MPLLTFRFVGLASTVPSTPPPPTKFASVFTPTPKCAELSVPRRSACARSSPVRSPLPLCVSTAGALSTLVPAVDTSGAGCTRWAVSMERPPSGMGLSRAEVIDYYVDALARVLGSEKEAQMSIYNASWQDSYCFKCDIDEESVIKLSKISAVLSVKPDTDEEQRMNNSNLSLPNETNMDDNTVLSKSSELNQYWLVQTEKPGIEVVTKAQVVDYYTNILTKVLGNEREAQMSIYNASWQDSYCFKCDIDEESAIKLSKISAVLSVKPDTDEEQRMNNLNLSLPNETNMDDNTVLSKSSELNQYWLVQTEKPGIEVVTKAQVVDYYTNILMKVLGNEKDAQVSIYRISWERDFWFCCHIDDQCARELSDLNEVLSVEPDSNFSSNNKKYGGENSTEFSEAKDQAPDVTTKRLFVTGLSFYTSEKTLRAAFEGFGELVEVKIIMDRISKRSKGYAFIEYTTEEAAAAALKEMNGKIINGWMIVVDVARANPPPRSGGPHSKP